MTLKFYFNNKEVAEFFRKNGYKITETTRGHFRSAYHNRSEWVEYTVLGVEIDSRIYDAEKIFQRVAEHCIKKMPALVSLDIEKVILKTIKEINR